MKASEQSNDVKKQRESMSTITIKEADLSPIRDFFQRQSGAKNEQTLLRDVISLKVTKIHLLDKQASHLVFVPLTK